jgi:DNA-binding MarR family transcriptional regulator
MRIDRLPRRLGTAKRSARPGRLLWRRLAWFRYHLRQFLRFSEQAARAEGVTPQQYQLLLGIAGYTGRGWATVGELAEFLQQHHNAAVGLIERAAKRGLVRKKPGATDRRYVRVFPTANGLEILENLSRLHSDELAWLERRLLTLAKKRPRVLEETRGASKKRLGLQMN